MVRIASSFHVREPFSLQRYSQSRRLLSYQPFPAEWLKMPLVGTTHIHHSPSQGFTDFQELYQSDYRTAGNHEAGGIVNTAVSILLRECVTNMSTSIPLWL